MTTFHTPGVPQPRHTLVWVKRLDKDSEKRMGALFVPLGMDDFDQAEVLAFGPGMDGVKIEDLRVGQIVLIRTQKKVPTPNGMALQKHSLTFTLDGDAIELVDNRDVLAVVRDAA